MSDLVIKAGGLSKRYFITHEAPADYNTFRDKIAHTVKNLSGKKKVGREREEFWALKDVSFEINKGDSVGIIGRNGAGKSTLLKILSRITEPTKGIVEINGRVSSLLEVGTGFHPELTGRENIFLNGAVLGMSRPEIKSKFDDIVEFSGVEKFLDTPVKRYSSGMYLRLAFSVAAYLEPEILIVDEVLAVGDAEFQKKCLGKMDKVNREEGRTVLFVSHNLEAIQQFCTKGILLQNGQLIQSGTMKSVAAEYIAGFSVQHTEERWKDEEAPGNTNARLMAAKVYDAISGNVSDFNTASGFVLELVIDYRNKERKQLDITYHLVDEKGVLVTVSSSAFCLEKRYYEPGKLNIKTSFPGNVLNEGTYTFSRILLVVNREDVIAEWNDVVSFTVLPPPVSTFVGQNGKEGVIKINNLPWHITVADVN
ncbi:MAG: ABC transporter ATP-binding protein [Bacteroidetes bacterium]|nr:ABC transporter ATP-binding protein [Bacteroidota bacterium]